jgi:hypothetical protein
MDSSPFVNLTFGLVIMVLPEVTLSFRQQETTAFGRGGMCHRVAGMSPHLGVGQGTTGFARGAPLQSSGGEGHR